VAARQHQTLNDMFREWLIQVNQQTEQAAAHMLEDLWDQTGYLRVGRKLSRDEMNER
jgi:hypothetical protein